MYKIPPVDLLEDVHEFPGEFTFKVIGRVENGFVARVVAAAREALQLEIDPPYSFREAKGGRHVAVTLNPVVATAEQVLVVYRNLQTLEGLFMLL